MEYKERETGKRHSDHSRGREAAATPQRELLEAHELAGELERLLGHEATTLRQFDNGKLLTILHRKESLVRELADKVSVVHMARKRHPEVSHAPQYRSLKTCLGEIERLNRSNQAFIEGTLSHYRHFIDCLCPSSYHPRHGNERQEVAAFKGLTFRKEV